MKGHKKIVLNYLQKGGKLTNMQAMKMGVGRVSEIVRRLRKAGHPIHTEWITTDSGTRIGRYYLPETII